MARGCKGVQLCLELRFIKYSCLQSTLFERLRVEMTLLNLVSFLSFFYSSLYYFLLSYGIFREFLLNSLALGLAVSNQCNGLDMGVKRI